MQTRWLLPRMLVCILAVLSISGADQAASRAQALSFADRIAALSEPGGYFDTDNLISNERTFLSVLPELQAAGVSGGAYVGVGPDQNFSYIAAVRPEVAVIIDIRRDNLLLHLLFKALFAHSSTRVEYLAQLCGRPGPADLEAWVDRPVTDIAAYVDQAALDATEVERLRERLTTTIRRFGVPLDDTDWATIDRFHRRFIEAGLGLQFQSTGRAPQWHYPTLGELLLATDGAGRQAHFLASEAGFRFVKDLQARDRIIPIVGDLAGPTAMRAIGRFLAAERIPLSTFYASNVEFYLWRQGVHERFVDNLRSLPRGERAMLIRSIFGGDGSVSEIEPIARLTRR